MTATWPQTLLDADTYPHPVDQCRLIETHISWVVLTGQYAYKIKKPVAMGFLDFSTLEKRKFFCERELELNRRLAEQLYLEVVPITGSANRPRIDGDGEVFEYAVKMRQFDNELLADNLARQGRLTDPIVRLLAKTLSDFHRALPAVDEQTAERAADAFYVAAMQNFSQIRQYTLPADILQTLSECEKWMIETYQGCLPLMDLRQRKGFIKDCHGDCHLGNIAIIDGEVTLFDCVEFNDGFRVMDTIAEAAFLSMDLCAHGLPDQSQRFINGYLEYRGDFAALSLLNLYRCYYAMVRAKVTLMKYPVADQPSVSEETNGEFYRYVALAKTFISKQRPALILMHGLSGSGKSWLAERIAGKIGAVRIRSDVERKRLFNLLPEQSGDAVEQLYSKEASRRTFERLRALAGSIVAAGFTCVVDATFLSASSRKPFIQWASEKKVPLAIISCRASEKTILNRLDRRATDAVDPSDANIDVYNLQKLNVVEFSEQEKLSLVSVNTERDDCVELVIAQLADLLEK